MTVFFYFINLNFCTFWQDPVFGADRVVIHSVKFSLYSSGYLFPNDNKFILSRRNCLKAIWSLINISVVLRGFADLVQTRFLLCLVDMGVS